MNAKGKIETLNSLIANERGFIRWSIIQATVPLLIGLAASGLLAYLAFAKGEVSILGETAKWLTAIPGLLGTAYGVFSIKDYFARKNRIISFQFLRIQYESSVSNPMPEDNSVLQEIDKRFWMLLDKNLA